MMNEFYQKNRFTLGLIIAIVRGIASRDTIQQAYNADKVIRILYLIGKRNFVLDRYTESTTIGSCITKGKISFRDKNFNYYFSFIMIDMIKNLVKMVNMKY